MRYSKIIYLARRTGSQQTQKGDIKATYGTPEEVYAAVYPMQNTQESMPYGYRPDDMRRIMTQAEAEVGDGIFLSSPAAGARPDYTIITKADWPMHHEWTIGRVLK